MNLTNQLVTDWCCNLKRTLPYMMAFALNFAVCETPLAQAASKIDAGRVSMKMNKVTLQEFIESVKKETGIDFLYSAGLFNGSDVVSVEATDKPMIELLDEVLNSRGYVCDYQDDIVVVRKNPNAVLVAPQQKYRTVSGVVKDAEGLTLPGVSVILKGTSLGVATDINGQYQIKIPDRNDVSLIFSFVGMSPTEIKVGTKASLNVVLQPDSKILEDVVITGYQTISKERATGSFAVLTSKDYEQKLQTSVLDRLEGMVAGVVSYNDKIQIRGISTLYGNEQPLYVVDGMPYEGSIDAINPSDISNVTVLKDATAASIYGARATNGVIVITTKNGAFANKKLSVSYNGSVRFEPVPDIDYLELMNSEELVQMQVDGFNYYHTPTPNKRNSQNEVFEIMYKLKNEEISQQEADSQLAILKSQDRRSQVKDELLRTAIKHQHNLSFSGGSENNSYMFSINYLGNNTHEKTISNERIGISLKDNMKLAQWLTADLGVNASFTSGGGHNGISARPRGVNSYMGGAGTSGALGLYTSGLSYQMLRDEDGNALTLRKNKSEYELDRLTSIGLYDERNYGISELNRAKLEAKSSYYRLQGGLTFKIVDGLTVDLKYQNENTVIKNRQLFNKDAYVVRNMINDAATYNKTKDEITYNIPEGGQLQESRADIFSYTMRAQVNYNKILAKRHALSILAGAERRLVRTTSTNRYLFGYDDNSLAYKPINPLILSPVTGTEAVNGSYNWVDASYNNQYHDEDRYVSFYGNGSYTFDERYALTASVRMDQSNLFGTDPKYQYKPLWSFGASWFIAQEGFMSEVEWLSRLNLRATYGINGNISKQSGPYLTVADAGYSSWTNAFSASILSPPNPELRWEKTAVTNIGLDFAVLNNRISGSVEYYNKKSTDLLGYMNTDPTIGWSSLMLNYGSMYNRGVEVALSTTNVKAGNFRWNSMVNFSYNKNRIVDIEDTDNRVWSYVSRRVNTVDKPYNSLYSYKWAGLNPENGAPQVYNEKGELSGNVQSLDALVYSGTTIPPYSASFTNKFAYKGLSLSVMFIYNGGHVLRDAVDYLSGAPGANASKRSLNYWRNPGDELNPDVIPAMNRSASYQAKQVWYAADVNVLKADYIKLRELTFGYELPKSMIQKIGVANMSVNLQINDLWWWAANDKGIDPEAYATTGYNIGSRTLPKPTTYTLGVGINF
ncbi:MAG: SusC/RagA family TonB-linked outer membrane protein [Marinifilaceae bacterium]